MSNDFDFTVVFPIICVRGYHYAVIYGRAVWPSYSYWIVPGTLDPNED